MKGYFKLFLGCILFFVPTLVWAQFESSPLWDMFQNLSFDPKSSDLSVAYLGKIFGAVPGVPQLASFGSTILGSIFGVFNAGVLALSGVFLSYTITRVVTETTMDGGAIGKSTTIWTSIRCALSTSLLVPQASGYSLINGIVMWIVIQSVGLANLTWDSAMNYLKAGGTTVAVNTHHMDYSFVNYDLGSGEKANRIGSADVLQSLTCAHAVHNALLASQKATHDRLMDKQSRGESLTTAEMLKLNRSGNVISALAGDESAPFSLYLNLEKDGVYQFPHVNTKKLYDSGLNINGDIPELSGVCGVISYGKNDKIYTNAKSNGLRDMINLLDPTAKQLLEKTAINPDTGKEELDFNKYVTYVDEDGKKHEFLKSKTASVKYDDKNQTIFDLINRSGIIKDKVPSINWPLGTDAIFSAAAAYQVAIKNAKFAGAVAAKDSQEEIFENAKKGGWILAGGYYRILSKVHATSEEDTKAHRLLGYKDATTPYPKDKINIGMRGKKTPAYRTLMPVANNYSQDSSNPIALIDGDTFTTLKNAMTWTQLSYPYSMLRGKTLESTASLGSKPDLSGVAFLGNGFGARAMEIGAYAGLVMGSIMLPISPSAGIATLTPIPMVFLMVDVNKIFEKWQSEMGSDSRDKDPIIKLHNLGKTMLEQSMAFIGQLTLVTTVPFVALGMASNILRVAAAIAGNVPFMNPGVGPQTSLEQLQMVVPMIQTIIFVTLPIALAVLIPMFVSGVMLYIYVPLIPFMLFLFGVLSWFISVVVLMAAAPIICFLMLWGNSSQENPLLAREAEQFLMQIIGVFFRPALMVIGLVVGVALSYIGVDILNTAFNTVIASPDLFSLGIGAAFAKKIALVIVYTTIMVSVVNMCFSPIHVIYSEVMRVVGISAPVVGAEERQLETVKGSISHTAEAFGGGIREGIGAAKTASTAGGEYTIKRQLEKEKNKKESLSDAE